MQYLLEYNWPGNIRELQNVIERYVITDINIESLVHIIPEQIKSSKDIQIEDKFEIQDLKKYMQEMEIDYIQKAVEACNGKVSEAAKRLHVHRSLLYKKLAQLNSIK